MLFGFIIIFLEYNVALITGFSAPEFPGASLNHGLIKYKHLIMQLTPRNIRFNRFRVKSLYSFKFLMPGQGCKNSKYG
jgi:hypothetical protein